MGTIVKDTILGYTKARQMKWDALFFGQVASFHPVIASQPDGVTDGFYSLIHQVKKLVPQQYALGLTNMSLNLIQLQI